MYDVIMYVFMYACRATILWPRPMRRKLWKIY